MSIELLGEAIIAGVLLGCFYAAVSVGLSIAFGLLDVPQIAHPAFLVLGAYGAYYLGGFGVDPLAAGWCLPRYFLLAGWPCTGSITLVSRLAATMSDCAGWHFFSV